MQNTKHHSFQAVIDTPIPGVPSLGIGVQQGQVTQVEFLFQHQSEHIEPEAKAWAEQMREYFQHGVKLDFSLSHIKATPFQLRVWQALRAIPAGEVRSYGELAHELATSARALANACRANPVPLLVPCHRVVSSHGIGGFMGQRDGLPVTIKRWLLQHEGYV